jgi:hypothetical protein
MPGQDGAIHVQCKCGKKLKAPATSAGKRAKCPACGQAVLLTAGPARPAATAQSVGPGRPAAPGGRAASTPKPAAARPSAPKPARPAPPSPPPEDDGLDALYDLAAQGDQAASSQAVDDTPRCPGCMQSLDPNAVFCIGCGYDLRTNRKAAITKVEAAKPPKTLFGGGVGGGKKVEDKMAPQGSFMMGLVVSFALALAASLIWFGVAWGVEWDIYYLSILIGVGAGVGMQIGQKGYSTLGGVAAAGITLVTLILVRVAIVVAIVLPALKEVDGEDDGADQFDSRVVALVTEESLKAAGFNEPEKAGITQYEAAHEAAVAKLKGMSQSEIDALTAKAVEKEEISQLASMIAEDKAGNASDLAAYMRIHNEAKAQVVAMTPDQRKVEMKRLEAKAEADMAARAATAGTSSDGPSAGAAVVGLALIFFLIFGIKPIIVGIIAMAIAFKTAAGSVSG